MALVQICDDTAASTISPSILRFNSSKLLKLQNSLELDQHLVTISGLLTLTNSSTPNHILSQIAVCLVSRFYLHHVLLNHFIKITVDN